MYESYPRILQVAMGGVVVAIACVASVSGLVPATASRRRLGPHLATGASFTDALWGLSELEEVTLSANVSCSVYEIGGPLTKVLSTTCSKELPLIPHVGVRLYGREYFYSDHIESRPVDVMAQMLGSFPQVTFDLGPPTVTQSELEAWLASPDLVSRVCARCGDCRFLERRLATREL